MSWWYYYSMFGPGHQSSSDGFFELPDNATEKDAREYVDERMYSDAEYGHACNYVWQVKKFSSEYQKKEIQGIKNLIAVRRREIKKLTEKLRKKVAESEEHCGLDIGEDIEEYDREVMMSLYGHQTEALLKSLHRDGITIDRDRLFRWEHGMFAPSHLIRERVIACGKRTKKNLTQSYINNRWRKETLEQWKKHRVKCVNFWIKMRENQKLEIE